MSDSDSKKNDSGSTPARAEYLYVGAKAMSVITA
jgi:hypothetical protein